MKIEYEFTLKSSVEINDEHRDALGKCDAEFIKSTLIDECIEEMRFGHYIEPDRFTVTEIDKVVAEIQRRK